MSGAFQKPACSIVNYIRINCKLFSFQIDLIFIMHVNRFF